jgi:TetR/AcrR family transcriptional repressor of nem operon
MSYQDISAVVGIRKASIHTHFPRKEDLVTALLIRYREHFLRIVDGIVASGDEPEVKLRRYCGLYAATLSSGNQNKVCLYAMLGAELNVLNSPLVAQIQQFYRDKETRSRRANNGVILASLATWTRWLPWSSGYWKGKC